MDSKEVLSATHKGWDTKEHVKEFDHWNKMSNLEFLFKYGSFEEQKYLKEKLKNIDNPTILDFGCATGTTYKYLKLISNGRKFKYKGVDISQAAIDKARNYYQEDDFELISENSDYLQKNKFDIVYSRDTVLHQNDPYEFIKSLLNAAKYSLILRLRTRDSGHTIFDVKNSCQLNYDNFWMPYIVLNFDELIDFLLDQESVSSIKINKSYMILGGQNNRYLAKELFYKKTGCSETSISIELSDQVKKINKKVTVDNNLEGQNFLLKNKRKALLSKLVSLLTNYRNWRAN